jgi:hypothetical protein
MELQEQIQFITNLQYVAGSDEAKAKFEAVIESLVKLHNITNHSHFNTIVR